MGTFQLSDFDLHLIAEGQHYRSFEKLGAHPLTVNGEIGTHFAVWAPNAQEISVIGDFNHWKPGTHPLNKRGDSGIWETFVPKVGEGSLYKFWIKSSHKNHSAEKIDPFGFYFELRPKTASRVWDISNYQWNDQKWLAQRKKKNPYSEPVSIYEVHLGSWKRVPKENNRWLTYREMAKHLVDYVKKCGFTHVELMPITEHPFDGSWGYQTVGYFAPTSRFGTPQDFMYLIDTLHQNDIGVILDWVPSHFPQDHHGLGFFDGTHLYEHADPRQGVHKEWGTYIFNYGRQEVRNFLISNALFWLDHYHIDGLRVDAVASILYLDYARNKEEWIANKHGGRENLEAIDFLRRLNQQVYLEHPDTMMFAEESTDWPMVSQPTYLGGLGFGFKWDMGWMNDTLMYFSKEPIHRKFHHNNLTFRMLYAFKENFTLPLSHDEVVHGKGSLYQKMPGDHWQKYANLRLLYGNLFTQPGKKLFFMGNEFGQQREWNFEQSLDWHILNDPLAQGLQKWVQDLNHLYREEPVLFQKDNDPNGFQWLDCNDVENSIVSFFRKNKNEKDPILVIMNHTPVPRHNYRVGVSEPGFWKERMNSDATIYGGSGVGNLGGVQSVDIPFHNYSQSIEISLPPLSLLVLKRELKHT